MPNPLVSIIVPIYKVEPYLRRCLDSIVNQTYTNLEIILVDDGSPDGCPQICDEYAARDNRIVVIHKENGGLSDARNAGLDICKGEYISFVDSDDWVTRDYIEALLSMCIKEKADIAIGNHTKVVDIVDDVSPQKKDYELLNSYQCLEKLFGSFSLNFTVAWGKIYKKYLWESLRFPNAKLYEDAYVCHLIYDKISTACFTNKSLYFYLQRSDSIMGKTNDTLHALEPKILFYNYLKKNSYLKLYKKMSSSLSWAMLQKYCNTLDKKFLSLAKAFYHDINNKFAINNLLLKIFLFYPKAYIFFLKKNLKIK